MCAIVAQPTGTECAPTTTRSALLSTCGRERNESNGVSGDWINPEGTAGLVSIVVPTHNRATLLRETLAALLGQTHRPLQIVVVDDGSEDDTKSVVRDLAASTSGDVEIVYEWQDKQSAPAARNAGARLTQGEYLVFMDDDDLVRQNFLESRIRALNENEGTNLAFGLWYIFDVCDGKYRILSNRGSVPLEKGFDWYSFFGLDWQLLLQGCVIRRQLVSAVGPWKLGLKKSQDMEYKARLLAHRESNPVYAGPDEPVYYRTHGASISGAINSSKLDSHVQVLEQIEAMTMERDDYSENKIRLADCLWTHAFWLYSVGERRGAYRQLQRAKVHDPNVCRRKGKLPAMFDSLKLDFAIGPLYYFLSRMKKSLGLSKRTVLATHDVLPAVHRGEG